MRSFNRHRQRVKFQDNGPFAEEHCTQVSPQTERVVATGAGGAFLASTERIRTTDTVSTDREGPRFPNLHAMFTRKPMHQEDLNDSTPKVTEEKKVDVPETTTEVVAVGGSINTRAEEFIQRRRQDLALQRLMSMNAA